MIVSFKKVSAFTLYIKCKKSIIFKCFSYFDFLKKNRYMLGIFHLKYKLNILKKNLSHKIIGNYQNSYLLFLLLVIQSCWSANSQELRFSPKVDLKKVISNLYPGKWIAAESTEDSVYTCLPNNSSRTSKTITIEKSIIKKYRTFEFLVLFIRTVDDSTTWKQRIGVIELVRTIQGG